ncbi:MAG: cobyrinate a,c-diamide synthase [Spirochaetia bacterium]|nr:cobyrinate a,c-diamide synthase [Spirochaetia bacterium]
MRLPRILIAGTSSGSGKTTATYVLLELLKRRGTRVKACKCGPDYIDPMFHKKVSGISCTNLDPFFCDKNLLRYLLGKNGGEQITVIEGVMGYYDGTSHKGTDNSTFTVAEQTDTPVILTVDAKGSASSLLAVIEGFLHFVPESHIRGVLFNRMTPGSYKTVKAMMQDRFGESVVPVGFIPSLPEECHIPSRHLGLVTAAEINDLTERLEKTADLCISSVDLDAVLAMACKAPDLESNAPEVPHLGGINLAVAMDEAFCFYYDSTFKLFEEMGAELRFFSPLADDVIPEESDGLIVGGGYPELYAEKLEANIHTKESVCRAISSGMPTIAECGGFQYLGETLDGHRMCGVLKHSSTRTEHLVRFGYIAMTSRRDGLFGSAGTKLKAHEFHYWDSTDSGDAFTAKKPDGREWKCAVMTDTLYAGYPHLFLPSNIPAAAAFYKKCIKYKEGRR